MGPLNNQAPNYQVVSEKLEEIIRTLESSVLDRENEYFLQSRPRADPNTPQGVEERLEYIAVLAKYNTLDIESLRRERNKFKKEAQDYEELADSVGRENCQLENELREYRMTEYDYDDPEDDVDQDHDNAD